MNDIISSNDVPKIIHHIWIQGYQEMNSEDRNNVENIKRLNPDWVHILWDDDAIRDLLDSKYPEILDFYNNVVNLPGSVNYLASKSDIARSVIVYEYGGCYMDVDVECVDNLDSIVKNIPKQKSVFACSEKYGMYSDSFFMASYKNQILKNIIENITKTIDKRKLGNNISNTLKNHKNEIFILNKYVSKYHCGSSYKCMIPIKINSNDNPFHPRRFAKYICDNRPQFMISGFIIILILLITLTLFMYKMRSKT